MLQLFFLFSLTAVTTWMPQAQVEEIQACEISETPLNTCHNISGRSDPIVEEESSTSTNPNAESGTLIKRKRKRKKKKSGAAIETIKDQIGQVELPGIIKSVSYNIKSPLKVTLRSNSSK